MLTSEASDDTPRVTVTFLTYRVVVELFFAMVALPAIEIWLAVALPAVIAGGTDRAGRITIAC